MFTEQGQVLYVVFQPVPHRERAYLWVNGDKKRESIKMEIFKKWVIDSEQEFLIPSFMKSFNTYSFYLWDKTNKKVFYLQPNIHSDDFKKPLTEEIKKDTLKKESKTLEEPNHLQKVFDQFTMVDFSDTKDSYRL